MSETGEEEGKAALLRGVERDRRGRRVGKAAAAAAERLSGGVGDGRSPLTLSRGLAGARAA